MHPSIVSSMVSVEKELNACDVSDFTQADFDFVESCFVPGTRAANVPQQSCDHRLVKDQFNRNRGVVLAYALMARSHQARGDFTLAQSFYIQSVALGRIAFKESNRIEFAQLLNRVGSFYYDCKMYREALAFYTEGLDIELSELSARHPNTIVSLLNVGEVCVKLELFNRALHAFATVMSVYSSQGSDMIVAHASAVSVLVAIGKIYGRRGQTKLALQHMRQALIRQRAVLGDHHVDVATTLCDLGALFRHCDMGHRALEAFHYALQIRSRALGRNHRLVSFTLYNIGLCYCKEGRYNNAIECYREAVEIEYRVLGPDHRDLALTLFELGRACKMDDQLDTALEYFQRSLAIERTQNEANCNVVVTTLAEIGALHFLQGNDQAMMESFSCAARTRHHFGHDVVSDHEATKECLLPTVLTALHARAA